MTKKLYFENLDGLRFLCFLSVFFYHSFYTQYDSILYSPWYQFIKKDVFGNGNLGVNFFFVLSGFLITFLLLEEKKMNGQINLKNFWIRRILRIWPLYFICVFFGFFIFPILKSAFGQTPNETASIWYYLTFINNFDMINKGLPDASILGALWSVAIEEQFYLIWPIILFLLPIKQHYIAFSIIILSSLIFRAFNDNVFIQEIHTLSCIGDMAIGAFGAWLIQTNNNFKSTFVNLPRNKIFFIYLAFALFYFFRLYLLHSINLIRVFERSIIAVIILFIILEQTYSNKSFFKLSNFKTLSKLGTISYGLYCLHFVSILITTTLTRKAGITTQLWEVIFIDTPIALFLTIIIGKISYRYFEKPFLKIKDKFAYITK